MKTFILFAFFFALGSAVNAQYIPNSGQAFQFASLYNPAFTGMETYNDLKLGYRYQWTGFKENAPKFINLSYNFRIKEPMDLTFNSLRSSQQDILKSIPKSKQLIHGLGFAVFNETVGLISRVGGGVNYAVHYPLTSKIKLSGGASAIIENTKLKVDEIYLGNNPDPDPFYDNLLKGGTSQTNLGLRAGFLVYSSKFYAGFSYYPLLNTSIKSSDLNYQQNFYRGSFQVGATYPISAEAILKPSIIGLLRMDNKVTIDYNLKLFLMNRAWAGLTYRDIKSGVVSAGFNINERFAASYSYEFSMGKLKGFSGGSHELVLAAKFNNFRKDIQRTW
jgi:type IX secretion system PorP/SprF family membrane protein